MTLFIVRPQKNLLGQFPELAARKITAESRQEQIQELAHFWKEDRTYQEIQNWIEEAQNFEVRQIPFNLNYPTLSGTTLVEMSDEEAERMVRDLSNIIILRDEPIELIRPTQDTITAKNVLAVEDIWHLAAIRRFESQKTGKNIKIAVFDTGIEPNHPEIKGKVTESYEFNTRQRTVEQIELENSQDTAGHGTHVAGLICGNTVGVAPEAELISILMLPKGQGSLINFLVALEWLFYRPDIRIVNISAGIEPRYREQMSYIINDLLGVGILAICAAGNEGRDQTRTPANCQGLISVSATNQASKVWGNSGSARMEVDNQVYYVPSLVAPGEAVYSCVINGVYEAWSGTSMATPIVSGVAALILEEEPRISAYDLKEELLRRCKPLLNELSEQQGKGIIQVKVS